MQRVFITGTGLYTPPHSISNEELVASYNAYVERFNAQNARAIEAGELAALQASSAEFIEKASGIQRRYVVDKAGVLDPERMHPRIAERPNSALSVQAEMAVEASKEALRNAGKRPEDVDVVIVACSNMQRAYPAMAVEIQSALGITGGYGFDMNVACSSATFGIEQAANALRAGSARAVLMVNPEICSGHLEFRDRDCHFIFGDVCTAVLLEAGVSGAGRFEVLGTKLVTSYSNNIRNNFGFLNRCDESGVGARDKLFVQEGRKVFKEVSPMVAAHIASHLSALEIAPADVKRYWLHQANLSMNQFIVRKLLGRDADATVAPVILDEFANTSSAGSVIAFHKYHQDLREGDVGVLSSFGAGYSVGSVVLRKA